MVRWKKARADWFFGSVAFGHVPHAALIGLPSVEVGGQLPYSAALLRTSDRRRDGQGGGLGHLVLNDESIGQVSLEASAPQQHSRRRVDEAAGGANAPFGAAHAAFHDVANAEFAASLTRVDRSVLAGEVRMARGHTQPAEAGQFGQHILGHPVGEERQLPLVGQVLEGKHRDGGPFRQRSGVAPRSRRSVGIRRLTGLLLFSDRTDETETSARQRLDNPLLPCAIADRIAGGIDACCQCRVGNDPAAPDGGNEIILADDTVTMADQEIE
jgi:hypothetical protein